MALFIIIIMEKYFVIDIGSNSIRLMECNISDGKITDKKKKLITARISENFSKEKGLDPVAMGRGVEAFTELANEAKKTDPDAPVYAFATSAVRDAVNKDEFAQKLFDNTGIRIDIISGEMEAYVTSLGALGSYGNLIDIGGGSTEILVKENGEITFSKSFHLGCVRAKNEFPEFDFEDVGTWTTEKLTEIDKNLDVLVGVGGTATSLAFMLRGDEVYSSDLIEGFRYSSRDILGLYYDIENMTPQEISEKYHLKLKRAEIIKYGIAILYFTMIHYGVEYIEACDSDNLEGYLKYKLQIE